ncbi:MAG: DUF1330 domain-containing protein [SAR202 cluster bacterium]|nr:DUF1330 domain-containing protein [SAR202 cluster bacterium]|tara:strand:- start:73 stop:372 length:300 start_codon:yes stop_codon:yes gene_type:complete
MTVSVYSISSITVKDWDTYREYMNHVPAIIEKYGGRYLVRGGDIISDDTSWQPQRVVILEFPDLAQMKAFRDSDEYKPVAELRHKAADTEGFVVTGFDG